MRTPSLEQFLTEQYTADAAPFDPRPAEAIVMSKKLAGDATEAFNRYSDKPQKFIGVDVDFVVSRMVQVEQVPTVRVLDLGFLPVGSVLSVTKMDLTTPCLEDLDDGGQYVLEFAKSLWTPCARSDNTVSKPVAGWYKVSMRDYSKAQAKRREAQHLNSTTEVGQTSAWHGGKDRAHFGKWRLPDHGAQVRVGSRTIDAAYVPKYCYREWAEAVKLAEWAENHTQS